MKPKTLVLMGVAIVCGLVAAYLTQQLASRDKTSDYDFAPVAVRELKAGEKIKPEEMFKTGPDVGKYLKGTRPNGAILDYEKMKGKTLAYNIPEGQPCLERDLADQEPLQRKLGAGEVAITIPVQMSSGVSGFVGPDARVNLISTSMNSKGQRVTKTFMQRVKVLAVNQVIKQADPAAGGDAPAGGAIVNPTVATLAVTPKQAQVIEFAKGGGTISMALRRTADEDETKLDGTVDITGTKEDPDDVQYDVVLAADNIVEGTVVTEKNLPTLFRMARVASLPKDAFTKIDQLKGKTFKSRVTKDGVVTSFYLEGGADTTKEKDLPPPVVKEPHYMVIYNGKEMTVAKFDTDATESLPPPTPKDKGPKTKGSDAP